MYIIAVVFCVLAILGLARHRRRRAPRRSRKGGRFQAIPFSVTNTLSTLGDNALISQNLLGAEFSEKFYAISVDATFSLFGGTVGEGPIGVGFAHNDLSTAEILENLNAEITDPSNIIAREQSRRPVRRTGSFSGQTANETLNDGILTRTPLKFLVGEGHGLATWAVNRSNGALTGGQIVEVQGTVYGRWV